MGEPKTSIILEAIDRLTQPVEGAKASLGRFGDAAKKVGDELRSFVTSKIGVAAIITAVGVAINKGFEAFDAYRASLVKLDGTAKIAGVSLQTLTDISEAAQRQFGLSRTQAADFAVEMAKLAAKAGDVGLAAPALQKFLDIGAARGLTAAETLKAVQQSILGIDEGTDKLFNKNPSVLYAEFAASIGTTAGKLTDTQKAQALLNAAVEDGSKVVGSYATYLESTAGAAEQASNKTEMLFTRLGEFLDPVRRLWIATKEGLVNIGAAAVFTMEAIGTTAIATVEGAWQFVRNLVGAGANLLGSFIHLVAKVSGPLRDELDSVSVRLVTWGEGMKQSSADNLKVTAATWKTRIAEIYGVAESGEEAITATAKANSVARVEEVAKEAAKKKEIWTGSANVFIEDEKRRAAAAKEAESIIRATWGLSSDYILRETNKMRTAHVAQAAALATIVDGMDGVYGASTNAVPAVEDVGDEIYNAARGAVSLANEFGAIDDVAASVLNNVVNLADSLKNGLSGIAAGDLIGAIGSLAGLLGTMFSDGPQEKARKELLLKNTQRLQELKDKMGELLNISTPGGKIAAFKGVDSNALIASGLDTSAEGGGRRVGVGQIAQFLASKGLSITDMRSMAKEFNIDLGDDGKNFSVSGIQAFFALLNSQQFSGFGPGLSDQVERNEWMTGIFGADPAGGLKGFAEALSGPNGSSAFGGLFAGVNLDDGVDADEVNTIRSRTMGLAARYATGNVTEGEMGGASNSEFMQYLSTVITYLDSIANTNATTASAVTNGGIGAVADTDMGNSVSLSTAAIGG